MKRIRKIGLAVLAALALSAVGGAGSASAAVPGFVADQYPAELTGDYSTNHTLSFNAGSVNCETPRFQLSSKAPSSSLTSTSEVYPSCENGLPGGKTTLKTNGCHFSYQPGAETSKGVFAGTFSIGPAGCGPMTVKPAWCPITIGAQSGLAATFTNVGSGSSAKVKITAAANNLTYTQSNAEGGCKAGTFKTGGWNGSWDLLGKGQFGAATGVRVVPSLPLGLFLTGEKSEEKAKQPKFEAEEYPASVLGEQSASNKFVFKPGWAGAESDLTCDSVNFGSTLSGAASQLALNAQYANCLFKVLFYFPATVSMNSCQYVLHVANSGPPYTGDLEVACAAEGDGIKINAPGCTLTITPQVSKGSVSYSNEGSSFTRRVIANVNAKGLEFIEKNEGLCEKSGVRTTGALTGTVVLAGAK